MHFGLDSVLEEIRIVAAQRKNQIKSFSGAYFMEIGPVSEQVFLVGPSLLMPILCWT